MVYELNRKLCFAHAQGTRKNQNLRKHKYPKRRKKVDKLYKCTVRPNLTTTLRDKAMLRDQCYVLSWSIPHMISCEIRRGTAQYQWLGNGPEISEWQDTKLCRLMYQWLVTLVLDPNDPPKCITIVDANGKLHDNIEEMLRDIGLSEYTSEHNWFMECNAKEFGLKSPTIRPYNTRNCIKTRCNENVLGCYFYPEYRHVHNYNYRKRTVYYYHDFSYT